MYKFNARLTAISLGLLVAGSALAGPAGTVRLERGTVVPVKLDQQLTSDHSRRGDTFTATVRSGYLGLAEGTRLKGIVRSARAKSGSKPGTLVLEFTGIVPPGGRSTTIDGSPVSLDSKTVSTSGSGRIVAKPGVNNKRMTYVGYGAGAGVLVSVLDGGKNLLRNAALGAGLGYLAASADKKDQNRANNVLLKSGLAMGVLLHKPATVRL
jgi:hypothetical protein